MKLSTVVSVDLLFYAPPIVCGDSVFVYVLVCINLCLSSFAIILTRKSELVALLLLSFGCLVIIIVLWLFLTVPWVGLQCVIVVFPDHTHFFNKNHHQINRWGFNYFILRFVLHVLNVGVYFLMFLIGGPWLIQLKGRHV